ncbi:MAG TPA: hypothetical protein DGG94_11905 [Micromonosporaceae bacterium]|nr:hypothetical protein [Micromonosporaceae bacterium]HCU50484.1 hypothetical protein [Micromonosporaceae bacterium]
MRAVLALLSCLALAACGTTSAPTFTAPSVVPAPSAVASPSAPLVVAPPPASPSGIFNQTASGGTGIAGTAGSLKRYCVQVEDGITAFTADEFAAVVDPILANHRSWIAGKKYMFQRVPDCGGAHLRIRLAVPPTVDRFCAPAADTQGKYSCRIGTDVFINLDRWASGVPHFPDLSVYRNMVINHEVGHFLGHGHRPCSGKGKLAPVMQRQSASLDGCQLNPYPYPDGSRYLG